MKTLRALTVITGVVFLFGCAQSNRPGFQSEPLVDRSHPRATLVLGAKSMKGNVSLVQPRVRETAKFPQASVKVQNLIDEKHRLEYKFDWSDADGFKVKDGTWKRFSLSRQGVRQFTSTGPSEEAHQFTFTVRPVDE